MNKTLIYVDGKQVGSVSGGIFYKTIHGSRHILRFPRPSIALDLKSIEQAELLEANTVKITDSETSVTYTATLAHIRAAGFELDRGCGKQIALPLDGWIHSRHGGELPKQLTLFRSG